jgi:molybdopterin synthase catalytic subunit
MMLSVTREPIDPAAVYGQIDKKLAGSVVCHFAVVKKQSGPAGETSGIEYDAAPDAEEELAAIAAELKGKWLIEDLLLIRRVASLGIGDIISLVAVSAPNSEDAFAACRHGIRLLKKMTTIVKKEKYAAG